MPDYVIEGRRPIGKVLEAIEEYEGIMKSEKNKKDFINDYIKKDLD